MRLRRPADLSAGLRALQDRPLTAAEAAFAAEVERRRAVLAQSQAHVGHAVDPLGDSVSVAQESVSASSSAAKGLLLHRLVAAVAPDVVVELGTAFGLGTAYLAGGLAGAGGGEVRTVDAVPARTEIARETVASVDPSVSVHLATGLFDEHFALLDGAGLVYVDGNHYAAPTRRYVEESLRRGAPDVVIVLDDIDGYSPEMDEVWRSLSRDRRFTATARVGDVGLLGAGRVPAL